MSNELLYLGSLCLLCVIGVVIFLENKLIKVETEPNKNKKIVIFNACYFVDVFCLDTQVTAQK